MVKKGVSPVIATILMVMITVGLVAFSYTWLMTVVEHGKETEGESREAFDRARQQIAVGTVFVNESGLYFELRAMGVNTLSIDMTDTKFYIEDIPKLSGSISDWILPACTSGNLAPGASCYGKISDYTDTSCHIGDTFRVAVSWGAETTKKIKGCTQS